MRLHSEDLALIPWIIMGVGLFLAICVKVTAFLHWVGAI